MVAAAWCLLGAKVPTVVVAETTMGEGAGET